MQPSHVGPRATGLLALAAVALVAWDPEAPAAAPPRDRRERPVAGATPEETFAASQRGILRGDYKAFFLLCDEESLGVQAVMTVEACLVFRCRGHEQQAAREASARVEAVLGKHGIAGDALRRFAWEHPEFPVTKDSVKAAAALLAPSGDLPRLLGELTAALDADGEIWRTWAGSGLEALEVEGDTATARKALSRGGWVTFAFRRVNGVWLFHAPAGEGRR